MRVSRAELERRLVHAAGAAIPGAYLLDVVTWRQLGLLLVAGSVLALVLEALRHSGALQWVLFDRLTREYEQEGLAAYALFLVGMTLTAWVFEPRAAVPGMLMLAIADPVSGLLGSGQRRSVKRAWVLAATFATATLLAVPFVPVGPAVLGGLATTVADGAKPVVAGYVVDDDLTIAPASAAAIVLGLSVA